MKGKIMAGVVGTVVLAAAVYLKTTYQVARVIDGDTFETKEKQVVRLAGVDAPELKYCGGTEAKQALEKLILGKRLQIKVVFNDKFKRLVSQVYAGNIYVNKKMLEQGWAYFARGTDSNADELLKAGEKARAGTLGIFGAGCTQDVNPIQPKCNIKGNIGQQGKETKFYRYPGCGQYGNTVVQLYLGDGWFCNEKEARAAGFVKGSDCKP